MSKLTHKQKVKMARKMRTQAESVAHFVRVGGKIVRIPPASIFNSKAWNERKENRALKEDKKRKDYVAPVKEEKHVDVDVDMTTENTTNNDEGIIVELPDEKETK